MKIPIELIGGAGFFPAIPVKKCIVAYQPESAMSSYEEELNILGIKGKSPNDLLKTILAIELQWILNASIKWKEVCRTPKKKFRATYQGVELLLSVDVRIDGPLGKHTGTIKIGRIVRSVSKVSSVVLLTREISVKGKLVFRKNSHYTPNPRNR